MKNRGRAKVHQTMVLNWLRKICRWPETTMMTRADFERLLETVPASNNHRERTDGPPNREPEAPAPGRQHRVDEEPRRDTARAQGVQERGRVPPKPAAALLLTERCH